MPMGANGEWVQQVAVVAGGTGGTGGGTSDTTEATQLAVKAAVEAINAKTPAAGSAQPISAASLPLPAGAATAAKQDVAAASLTSIDGKTPALVGGAVPVAGPVTDTQLRASPVPVSASARQCVGRQTLALSAGVVTTLTVPAGAVAAAIQADGNTVRCTLDGATAPSASVGTRIDDGVIYYVDTALANVKLLAPVACSAQVVYFDKA